MKKRLSLTLDFVRLLRQSGAVVLEVSKNLELYLWFSRDLPLVDIDLDKCFDFPCSDGGLFTLYSGNYYKL